VIPVAAVIAKPLLRMPWRYEISIFVAMIIQY
jgi:hypothetical protein